MSMAHVPDSLLTISQHLEDYDFAVKYVEDNYSGFANFVTASTRADYDATKSRLRGEVERGERPGWDAVSAYAGWFSDFHMVVSVYNGNPFEYFHREFVIYPLMMEEYRPAAVARQVTKKTFLIRFPSCGGNPDMEWIKNSVAQFKKSRCENLILDIRGNSGGADYYFYPYLELLYDHDATLTGMEFRNTPQNMAQLKELDWFPAVRQAAMEQPQLEYIALPGDTIHYKRDKRVRKAAVIIDNAVASSGEEMVIDLRACSDRVTVYGRDNSFGCIDFANVSSICMPHCGLRMGVPMSRRRGLPETSIDKTGIVPDVGIDLPLPAKLADNIDDWVVWVAAHLERK
jgi:hypothetical protein